MELGQRLKDYRARAEMTQEELADRLYVSRQTISSWENDKSYPDIHSLLLMSDLFGVSLDTMIRGDIEIMKKKVDQTKRRTFQRDSNIFATLLIVCIAAPLPLYKWIGTPAIFLWAMIAGVMLYFMWRVERTKKEEDIYTYREIVAYTNGMKLDGVDKAVEEGKRSYQNVLFLLVSACALLLTALLLSYLL